MTRLSGARQSARRTAVAALPSAVLLSLLLGLAGCTPPPAPPLDAILLAASLPGQALQLKAFAHDAAQGNSMAFDELAERQQQLRNDLGALQQGDASRGIATPAPGLEAQLRELQSVWNEADKAATHLIGLQKLIETSAENAQLLAMQVPQFQSRADELFRSLSESDAPPAQLLLANRLLMVPERILRRLPTALAGGPQSISSFDMLMRDCSMLQGLATSLREGSAADGVPALSHARALEALTQLDRLLPAIQNPCGSLVSEAHQLIEAHELAQQIGMASARLQGEALALLQQYRPAK